MGKNNKFFRNKAVLTVISLVCVLGILLSCIIFTGIILDCINVEEPISYTAKNKVGYTVLYDDPDGYFSYDEFSGTGEIQKFLQQYTEEITVWNEFTLNTSESLKFSYTYTARANLIWSEAGNGRSRLNYRETKYYYPAPNLAGSKETDTFEIKSDVLFTEDGRLHIDLQEWIDEYNEFAYSVTGVSMTGRLEIDFEVSVWNSNGTLNKTVTNGIIIPLTDKTYYIEYKNSNGSVVTIEDSFPPRNVHFPTFIETAVFVVIMIALITLLVVSCRRLFTDPDEYKRNINHITRKYYNDIVMIKSKYVMPNTAIEVDNFKELLKFSQNLSKPIVCAESSQATAFYILCDDVMYKYEIAKPVSKPRQTPPELRPQPPAKPAEPGKPAEKLIDLSKLVNEKKLNDNEKPLEPKNPRIS